MRFQLRYKFFFLFAFFIILAFIFYLLDNQRKKYVEQYLKDQQSDTELLYNSVLNLYEHVSKVLFLEAIDKPSVAAILAKASGKPEQEKQQLRDSLYAGLQSFYTRLNSSGVKHLHFYLPACESFLDFYEPEKSTETLQLRGNLLTICSGGKKYVKGFERGTTFSGVRYVFPLFFNEKHVGNMEIGFSFNDIRRQLAKSRKHDYCMLLKRTTNWQKDSSSKAYVPSDFSEKYVYEKALREQHKKFPSKIEEAVLRKINKEIKNNVNDKLLTNRAFTLITSQDDLDYLVVFIPILNVKHETIAYLISYQRDEQVRFYTHTYLRFFAIIALVVLALLWFAYEVLKRKKISERSKNYLQRITDSLGEGILVTDSEERIRLINPEAESLLGYFSNDVLGKTIEELEIVDGVQLFETGEHWLVRNTGEKFPAIVTFSPIYKDGDVNGQAIVFRDISEHRQSLEKLEKQKEELQSLNMQILADQMVVSEQNRKIELQKNEIQIQHSLTKQQKEKILLQNKRYKASFTYARRIQDAILPPTTFIRQLLPEHFIFYRPKDIVSGDFYWVNERGNQIVIAVGDCTGHGVPGAFMSMLGSSLLNETVDKMFHENENLRANEILNRVKYKLISSLRQTGKKGETQDGIDMALCVLNLKDRVLQYAGAYNPIFLVSNGEITQFRGDLMPIGIHSKQRPSFTNHQIDIYNGDIIYLFSDGFTDQWGEKRGRKFMKRPFRQLLLRISEYSMKRQKEILAETFDTWRGKERQIDDVLVMGFKIVMNNEAMGYNIDEINWAGKRILIAEDETISYMILQDSLLPTQAELKWVKDGKAAVEEFQKNKFDLVIMDIRMPILNGFEATQQIKYKSPDTPIIMLTAYNFSGEKEKAFKAGCDDYITKPLNLNTMFRVLSKYLK